MDAETGFVATNFSEETHSNGKVALRLSTDSEGKNEAGFAYYPSGRVAGCVSKAVTYGILGSLSYFYEDDKDRTLLAFFDHEANGFALSNLGSHQCLKKGCECQNYNHAPAARFLCKHCNHELTSHQQGRKQVIHLSRDRKVSGCFLRMEFSRRVSQIVHHRWLNLS
eukprot:151591_1